MEVQQSSSIARSGSSDGEPSVDMFSALYPTVKEGLPKMWSQREKCTYLGLTHSNLRVHYKGTGKNHKDAASVRASSPIPSSCGIYYFEVRIISKGRDGYMGIGLSAHNVNLNRLPGWDKQSYGYHGDDGFSFNCTGTGEPYGPTFTTGDVIGCCVNLIDSTCFFTKNGTNLGIAFKDIPHGLHPTVGLQTPGEVVEANFGQKKFVFDIEDYVKEYKLKVKESIEGCPLEEVARLGGLGPGDPHSMLHKVISSYLVHYGYCSTAEAFVRSSGNSIEEELVSIQNRQGIQKLLLAGKIGEGIKLTHSLYPGLLERNRPLLFQLKCRQFIEMLSGNDAVSEPLSSAGSVTGSNGSLSVVVSRSPRPHFGGGGGGSPRSSPSMSPHHYSSSTRPGGPRCTSPLAASSPPPAQSGAYEGPMLSPRGVTTSSAGEDEVMSEGGLSNGGGPLGSPGGHGTGCGVNGSARLGGAGNHHGAGEDMEEDDEDFEMEPSGPQMMGGPCGGNRANVERLLRFGRELQSMCTELCNEHGRSVANENMLKDAFSLLAYSDPWNSPVGHQLDPVAREPVCAALNSAILESHGLPKQPALELLIGQVSECIKLMAHKGLGANAFAPLKEYTCLT